MALRGLGLPLARPVGVSGPASWTESCCCQFGKQGSSVTGAPSSLISTRPVATDAEFPPAAAAVCEPERREAIVVDTTMQEHTHVQQGRPRPRSKSTRRHELPKPSPVPAAGAKAASSEQGRLAGGRDGRNWWRGSPFLLRPTDTHLPKAQTPKFGFGSLDRFSREYPGDPLPPAIGGSVLQSNAAAASKRSLPLSQLLHAALHPPPGLQPPFALYVSAPEWVRVKDVQRLFGACRPDLIESFSPGRAYAVFNDARAFFLARQVGEKLNRQRHFRNPAAALHVEVSRSYAYVMQLDAPPYMAVLRCLPPAVESHTLREVFAQFRPVKVGHAVSKATGESLVTLFFHSRADLFCALDASGSPGVQFIVVEVPIGPRYDNTSLQTEEMHLQKES